MARYSFGIWAAAQLIIGFATVYAQSCTTIKPSGSIQPSIASGYAYAVVATGLTTPRSLKFDSAGNLLVLEQNSGLSNYKVQDNGNNCLSLTDRKVLFSDNQLTHGLELSPDGRTVFVSTQDILYSRTYDPANRSVGGTSTTIVRGMAGSDHTTRTILIPRHVDGQMLVARGSTQNVDPQASNKNSGISTVKSFNYTSGVPSGGYTHSSSGFLLGWGLRNEVGIVEHPVTGGIWGVENSVDQLTRDNQDVHLDNPGEELNFLGYLNGTTAPEQGTNYGYPNCLAAWSPSTLPSNGNIKVGTQFASTASGDSACSSMTPPRLTFQAHTAPLDIKFNNSATDAWISYHGSWNRNPPSGYSVAKVKFSSATGEPEAARDSNTAAQTIFANQNLNSCPYSCHRPVGLEFDSQGRLYVASDGSGEIYVIRSTTPGTKLGGSFVEGSTNDKRDNAGAVDRVDKGMFMFVTLLGMIWLLA